MKRTIIIFTVVLTLVLSAGVIFAKSGPSGQGGRAGEATGSKQGDMLQTHDREMLQTQDQERLMLQTQDRDCLCYKTKDGRLYEWKNSYDYQLRKYEKNDDEQRLYRYLREIVNRYRFENQSDGEGFIEWALKNRPWNIE
jgi:hypothetical protein